MQNERRLLKNIVWIKQVCRQLMKSKNKLANATKKKNKRIKETQDNSHIEKRNLEEEKNHRKRKTYLLMKVKQKCLIQKQTLLKRGRPLCINTYAKLTQIKVK